MKRFVFVALASVLIAAYVCGESAHKGWRAIPDQWPSASGGEPLKAQDRGSTYQSIPIKNFRMQGPFVSVDTPDPPAKASFKGQYWFRQDSTVTVQKVYMMLPSEDGTINTREIKTTPLRVSSTPIVKEYLVASFDTEETSFKEGDVFVVVFKVNGAPSMVFLRILYCPFEPS